MVLIEKSFPRGGTVKKQEETTKQIVFGARQDKIEKKKKHKKKTSDDFHETAEKRELEAYSAELLTKKTIREGMLIMGSVKKVDPIFLQISLPGRLSGRVLASNISDSYTDMLNKYVDSSEPLDYFRPLNEMYHFGQMVYVKVNELTSNDDGKVMINLSMKPSDVHSNMQHEKICKGMVFNGAIKEIQEHGYVIETGIKNLRCFLPSEKITGLYSVGQLIFLKIDKITHTTNASTAICKAVKDDNIRIKEITDPNMNYILPGTIVRFKIEKNLKDGLQGTIMDGAFKAYVNEHHLPDPLASPNDFEEKSTVSARLLYIMPLSNIIYLTMNLKPVSENEKAYQRGDTLNTAKVQRIGTGGIILNLDDKAKGLISFKTIRSGIIGNYDHDQVLSKYANGTELKVRIIAYDQMDSLYICSDDPGTVNEKYYSTSDLKIGNYVTARIIGTTSVGGYTVKVGRVKGIIDKIYLAPMSSNLQENAKLNCRVIAETLDNRSIFLTNRPEYMSKNCRLLTEISQAKEGKVYTGTIVNVGPKFLLIKFCNNIKGVLFINNIKNSMDNDISSFHEGQTMPFRIAKIKDEQIILGLEDDSYKIGDICTAKVNSIIQHGLDITINDEEEVKGLVPTRLLSDFPELAEAKLRAMKSEDCLEVVNIASNIFSIRDVRYFRENTVKHFNSVQPGFICRAYVKNVTDDFVELSLPIKGYNRFVKLHKKMFLEVIIKNPNIVVYPDQVIHVKVQSVENVTKHITVSALLTDVWDGDLKVTGDFMATYIDELNYIKEALKSQKKPLGSLDMGDKVNAKLIACDDETKDWTVELSNGVRGVIKSVFIKKPKELGTSLNCVILWIDYLNEVVYLSHTASLYESVVKGTKMPKKLTTPNGFKAKIVLKTNDVMICASKIKDSPLFFIPTRLHYNDFEGIIGAEVKEGDVNRFICIHKNYPIAVFKKTQRMLKAFKVNIKRKHSNDTEEVAAKKIKKEIKSQNITISSNDEGKFTDLQTENKEKIQKKTKDVSKEKSKKRKHSENETNDLQKILTFSEDKSDEDEIDEDLNNVINNYEIELKKLNDLPSIKKSKRRKEENMMTETNNIPQGKLKKKVENNEPEAIKNIITKKVKTKNENKHESIKAVLPGASGFWSNDLQTLTKSSEKIASEESSDDVENDATLAEGKKKKKLTASERFHAAREEEARLREIEEKLANPNLQPETADQFDRLVLANPNSSKKWIEYMVFHLTATEIDKARTVARKALKAINFREEEEILNIWVALLNLELRYGTKESFNDILKESVICNDPYKIYVRAIQILTDSQKIQELSEMIKTVTKKFKDKSETWKIAANAFFEVGQDEKAKQLLHKALSILPERDHINTIVSFANLNYKYGDKDTAHTLLEQIITSYPKRVDVWCQYVDMLIKDAEIESARRTLERSVIQKIPLKKMRTLFKKYVEFESRYGNEESVEIVRQMAAKYVEKEVKK